MFHIILYPIVVSIQLIEFRFYSAFSSSEASNRVTLMTFALSTFLNLDIWQELFNLTDRKQQHFLHIYGHCLP
jgi:hypothetical protein